MKRIAVAALAALSFVTAASAASVAPVRPGVAPVSAGVLSAKQALALEPASESVTDSSALVGVPVIFIVIGGVLVAVFVKEVIIDNGGSPGN